VQHCLVGSEMCIRDRSKGLYFVSVITDSGREIKKIVVE
jgi:hypothetical protein